jgi:histidine ammonia-lyase
MVATLVLASVGLLSQPAAAADYHPITPSAAGEVVTLTGHDLTIEQLIAVARYGARVQYSPDALKRAP